jgi:Family of unknown function (DUF6221)
MRIPSIGIGREAFGVTRRLDIRGNRTKLARFLSDRLADDTSAALERDRESIADLSGAALRDIDRQFREIAAKRALIRLCIEATLAGAARSSAHDSGLSDAVIRELVTVYADHPDFDPSWSRVDGRVSAEGTDAGAAVAAGTPTPDEPNNVIPMRSRGTERR